MTVIKTITLHVLLLLTFSPLAILALPATQPGTDMLSFLRAEHVKRGSPTNITIAGRDYVLDTDGTDRLACIPTNNDFECQVRATQNQYSSYASIDIYDGKCNRVSGPSGPDSGGNSYSVHIPYGTHASIGSLLPYTVELDVWPQSNWQNPPSGWYAGHSIGMPWNQENGQLPKLHPLGIDNMISGNGT
ncbi:hypothetical protein BDZ45DRAFT_741864 [Acephala macrosclerotiorum]|nr:hypothetical protein BDZ45DRAFT_741864 [Acephala macrosclerotiorum]